MNRNQASRLNSYWLHNKSKGDVILADLDITIRSGQVIDLYQLKPNLRSEYVRHSERFGMLGRRLSTGALLKLSGEPTKKQEIPVSIIVESKEMRQTRSRSTIEIDPSEKDFIEQLEKSYLDDLDVLDDHKRSIMNDKFAEEVDLDGFINPLEDDEEEI